MQKTNFFLLFVTVSLLTGCTGNVFAQVEDSTPTTVFEKVAATATLEVVSRIPPASCPVTVPQEPAFVPPAPYNSLDYKGYFWFGSDALWVSLPDDGVWYGLPDNPEGYTQKIPWWRDGYIWDQEPQPLLVVTGERMGASAPALNASTANGAYAEDMGSAMMMGVDIPTLGCWKITRKYKDAELSFVIWVAP